MTDTLITTAAIIMTGTTIGTETSQAGMTPSRGGHSLPTRCCRGASEREVMPQSERCNQCDQALIKIDNRGEQLVGCLTCNLWAAAERERWIRLSEEDLRALHQLRHGGLR